MGKMIFLSHVLDCQTPLYGGKGKSSFAWVKQIKRGDVCNTMLWTMGNHTGTHVDMPRHFIDQGATVDQPKAEDWLFENVMLVHMAGIKPGEMIMPQHLGRVPRKTDLLLIKTGFERQRGGKAYWQNAPALHPALAGYLKMEVPGLRAVGVDLISIANVRYPELGCRVHRDLLRQGVCIIEDMKLTGLKETPKKVLVSPLRVKSADGAPCSVFAWCG